MIYAIVQCKSIIELKSAFKPVTAADPRMQLHTKRIYFNISI